MTEKALKAAIFKTTARKRAFKRLSAAEQEAAAAELLGEGGDSTAAFFDILALRKTGRNRATQVSLWLQRMPQGSVDDPPAAVIAVCKALPSTGPLPFGMPVV